jgi:hypothetical protein
MNENMIPTGNGKMHLFNSNLPENYPKELLNDSVLKQCLDSLKRTNQLHPEFAILYIPSYINHPIIKLAQNQPNPADLITGMVGIKPVFKIFHRDHPAIQALIGESLNNDKVTKNIPLFVWIIDIDNEEIEWGWIPYIFRSIASEKE